MRKLIILAIALNFSTGCKTLNPNGMTALNNYIQQDLRERDQRRQFNAVNTRLQPINRPQQIIITQPASQPVSPYSNDQWVK